ncbi:GNAT family N-acetyltransferase [Flavisolibacter tropicus]|uniref:BioF2-like acetyltransferase domain-containing protein n=1 Tax=Flavisolibacter tropicus TaxID=1492898 RepID=A0A172TQ76_9BACT|nr:GNAT family N-acetyltransferase [Flavisolibacter tropicus]ANE49205.1 hypothetical protein SY85_00485 [Flavisolibacter tropicus]
MKTQATSKIALQSLKGNNIAIHVGEDAWQLLSNSTFLANWDKLFESCPWATIFQHQSFALTWYKIYRTKFLPVLVIAECEDQLNGLLTLAAPVSGNKGQIVGAGHYDAEYHTWLTDGTDNGSFIQVAFTKLLQLFPQYPIYLRYIPPHTPIQWMREPKWKKRCVWLAGSRPLMNLNDPNINMVFRKDDLKLKLNRLKRLGEVSFERITDKGQFAAILNELATLYDFRQGAMFNKNQFLDDLFKKDFILALFDQNLLHVTVLKVSGKIFASISAVTDQEWVYLSGGFNVHAPFYAKRISPGYLSFMLLGQQLVNEGKAVLDLTPGGDFYKERMATSHEPVCELIVTDSVIYRAKRQIRRKTYEYLAKAGKWPMGAELALRKRLYLLKNRVRQVKREGVLKTAVEKLKKVVQPPAVKVYISPTTVIAFNDSMAINKNELSDLLLFVANGTLQTRWEFLEDAMRRYGHGESSYTYCKDGRLLYCIWRTNNVEPIAAGNKLATEKRKEENFQLENMYCHSEGREKQNEFLKAVAHAITEENQNATIRVVTSTKNKSLCQTLYSMGFTIS